MNTFIDVERVRTAHRKYAAASGADKSFRAHQLASLVPELLDGLDGFAAEVERLSAIDADRIARAIGDPGSIVGRKLGPSWGEGNPGYAPEEESVTRWATRAVLALLGGGA